MKHFPENEWLDSGICMGAQVQDDFGSWHRSLRFVEEAAMKFALGSHAPLNSLAIGMLNDLVQVSSATSLPCHCHITDTAPPC